MIEVRRAGKEHIRHLVELCLMVQAEHREREPRIYSTPSPESVGTVFESWIQDGHTEFWLGFLDGAPVGYVALKVHHRPETPFTFPRKYLEIDQLGTAPEAQGRGVGRALLRHAEQRAVERGIFDIRIGVRAGNQAAVAFYEHMGYRAAHLQMVRSISETDEES
jgi:ribosomal protein S18 acetylase RimI-like enzyme